MGIGDSIGKAAENAMEDLAGTSKPTEGMDVPEPTDPNSDVEVHSSISEGSNALEAEKEEAPGLKAGPATGPVSGNPIEPENGSGTAGSAKSPAETESARDTDTPDVPRDVPGPAGLPEGDPGELRADPSEGGQDPSTGLGRS